MIRNDSLKKKSNKRDTPLESEDESLIIFFQSKNVPTVLKAELQLLRTQPKNCYVLMR